MKSLPEVSAEAALEGEITALGDWLAARGLELRGDKAHAEEGSRDRLYWRYILRWLEARGDDAREPQCDAARNP